MQGFPENLIGISKYVLGLMDIPYVPGAPFLLAGALSMLALISFILATNKSDRDERYAPDNQTKDANANSAPEG